MSTATLLLLTGLPGTGTSTLADHGAARLGGSVLAHDWAMAGLRPFPGIAAALAAMDYVTHRSVGWSLLWRQRRRATRQRRGVSPSPVEGVVQAAAPALLA